MIGLLPAAGKAERMHGLPKFLLPIGDSYLLERHVELMRQTTSNIWTALQPDTFEYFQDFILTNTYTPIHFDTMSETVLSFRNILEKDKPILFGMPDTYIEDNKAYRKLATALDNGADVAVGLFNIRPGQYNGGLCRLSGNQVAEVIDKPGEPMPDFCHIWGAIAWQPNFWTYIQAEDPHVGYALPRAVADGKDVRAVVCEGAYWDCGTPADYFECIRRVTDEPARS